MSVRIINNNSSVPMFSDIDPNFTRNPKTSDLLTLTNSSAVRQSIRNLISTSFGERLFQPRVGGSLRNLLFEPIDQITTMEIRDRIFETIRRHEPRVGNLAIDVSAKPDENYYTVTVEYGTRATAGVERLTMILERLR
jgi:phage baseplate assembly protein W